MLSFLLSLALSLDETAVQRNVIGPAQRILSFPEAFTTTETASSHDPESGAIRHRFIGGFGDRQVRLFCLQFPDNRTELSWVEALGSTEWYYEHPSRKERGMAADLLARELEPAVVKTVRAVGYRWKRESDEGLYQLALLSEVGGKRVIHRVDYTNDTPSSIALVQIVEIWEGL
jgi:hypothetical protein